MTRVVMDRLSRPILPVAKYDKPNLSNSLWMSLYLDTGSLIPVAQLSCLSGYVWHPMLIWEIKPREWK